MRRAKSRKPSTDDLLAATGAEVIRSAARCAEQAGSLEGVGARALDATGDLGRDATPTDLADRAQRVRALVLHALCLLMDLQYEAGRLDALAAVRRAGDAGASAES